MLHSAARKPEYNGGPTRFAVPDDKVPFSVAWPEYAPTEYTAAVVAAQPVWADDPGKVAEINFNELDGKVNRVSFEGKYGIDTGTKLPLNPKGRTGMVGRGLLGRFGPNHAADPIVTRWKTLENGQRVLEVVLIKRKDTGDWAIPGGMVDPGEEVSVTLKREFGEEALNTVEADASAKEALEAQVDELFKNGAEVFKGYVDDPRNTDNAWMETVAMNFHDESGDVFGRFALAAGDDAGAVAWVTVSDDLKLYASHTDFVRKVAAMRGAPLK